MIIQLLQFSDIHFRESGNSLLEKKSHLFNAIKNELSQINEAILIVTGDSAFSGSENEFNIAEKFYLDLKEQLKSYNGKDLRQIVIPGNHDCQDLVKKDFVRKTLLESIQKPNAEIELDLIKSISQNLTNYFHFEERLNVGVKLIYSSELIKVYQIEEENRTIVFYCYNTAFQSTLHEIPGKMVFPLQLIQESIFQIKADLKISLFHHPLNWLAPTCAREFKNHIERTSDFFFTGHEHINTKSQISDLEENFTYHIEGDVLQDSDTTKNSGFNIVNVDLDSSKFQVKNFKWNGERYSESDKNSTWIDFKRGVLKIKNPYQISESFKAVLGDIGANFSHPNIGKIKLSDLYVYPNLELLNQTEGNEKDDTSITFSSEELLKKHEGNIRFLISGSENIGKTALLKNFFLRFHSDGYLPIFVDGHEIKSTSLDDLSKLFKKSFIAQYVSGEVEDYNQVDKNKLIIVIDDFNRSKINLKYKARLLENLISIYPNLVISGNELMSLEDILTDANVDSDLYSSFSIYEVKEFGHALSSTLAFFENKKRTQQAVLVV